MKKQILRNRWCALLTLSACLFAASSRAELIHQYGFNQPSTDIAASDFISLSDGTLVNGVAFENTNILHFFGTNGYLDLPNGIISTLTDATFETWVTWHGGDNWQRFFDFGNGTGGENPTTNVIGTGYLFFTPKSAAGSSRFGIRRTNESAENLILDGPVLPTNVMTHVVISYSPTKGYAKLFINGQFVSQGIATQPLSSIEDVNNWLGRSQFTADTNLNASMDEFRIYDSALTPAEVAASYSGGSSNNSTFPGTLAAVRLVTPATLLSYGSGIASTFADYSIVTNVNVTAFEGAAYASSDTNILTVNSNGVIRGVAPGTATVTVTFETFSDSKSIQVVYPYANAIKHRYSFSELAGPTITDSVSGSNGTLVNPSNFSTFSGGGLVLSNLPSLASSAAGSSFRTCRA